MQMLFFLCGKETLEQWGSKLDTRQSRLETCLKRNQIDYKMVMTKTGHYGIKLEIQDKKENEIMYLDDKESDLTMCASIKKV